MLRKCKQWYQQIYPLLNKITPSLCFHNNFWPLMHLPLTNQNAILNIIYNNYSMSPSWIWSDKITNKRVARVGYNHFISNKGEWNNVLVNSQTGFCRRFLFPQFYKASGKSILAHYFPYDVKLRLLAHSRSFLANQKARNAIVGAENLLNRYSQF